LNKLGSACNLHEQPGRDATTTFDLPQTTDDSESMGSAGEEKASMGPESSPDLEAKRKDVCLSIDDEIILNNHNHNYHNNSHDCTDDSNILGNILDENDIHFISTNNNLDSPCYDNVSLSDSEPFMIQHIDSDSQSASPNNFYTLIHSGLFVQESEV
jgi:hypothetical protein